jgi:hypothetical protein
LSNTTCAANQTTLNHPVSEFVTALVRLVLPTSTTQPGCGSYAELRRQLQANAPDVERPDIRTNRRDVLRHRPFRLSWAPAA